MSRTVVTVLRSGGHYTQAWVRKLARGIREHTGDADVVEIACLTDQADRWTVADVLPVELAHDWPGWWSKIEVFRHQRADPVLYLDLDTLVLGSLAPIFEAMEDYPLADRPLFLEDFYRTGRPATGVMYAIPERCRRLYDAYQEGTRQRRMDLFVEDVYGLPSVFLQDIMPGKIVSLKAHATTQAPDGAVLVCGHGRPRFDQPAAGWAHKRWRAL